MFKHGISVLMSVYKGTKVSEFRETIRSIKDQTLSPNQIVLTIDGPITMSLTNYINGTLKDTFHNLSIYKIPYNSGLANALNKGMKLVKYDLIARVDTDDILAKNRFYLQDKAFRHDSSLSIVGGYVQDFHKIPGDMTVIRKTPCSYVSIKQFGKRRNPLNHPTVMIKTDVLYNLGGYPEFHLFEDYALWITAIHKKYKIHNLPKVLVYMRVNDKSLERRGGLSYFFNYIRLEKYFYSINYVSIVRLIINSILMFFNATLPVRIKSFIYNKFLREN